MSEKTEQIRSRTLRLYILDELAHTPTGYALPDRALTASLQFALVPAPTQEETEAALARLELDGMVTCQASPLRGKGYRITAEGEKAITFDPR